MQEIKTVLKNSKVRLAICIFVSVFFALIIFQAGVFVGFKKASFSFRTGEQCFRQVNGRLNGAFVGIGKDDFPNSHGAIGKILSIKLPIIVVSDRDNVEKTIIVGTSTDIRQMRNQLGAKDLRVNDFITVIGEPNTNAEIEAKLIRLMPTPEILLNNSTSTIK